MVKNDGGAYRRDYTRVRFLALLRGRAAIPGPFKLLGLGVFRASQP